MIARAYEERDHIFYSQVKMFALTQVRTFFVDVLVTFSLICVVHSRGRLGRPVTSTCGERSPEKMESRVARHCADLRLCSKKSTYDIRPQQPMPGVRSEGGMKAPCEQAIGLLEVFSRELVLSPPAAWFIAHLIQYSRLKRC